jgi:hypothetical protein
MPAKARRRPQSAARGGLGCWGESEHDPVRIPPDVLEGLEAVRRYTGARVLDVATIRYVANERGQRALAVWIHRHPDEYGRGLLDGFKAANDA